MKKRNTMQWLRSITILPILALALSLVGCESEDTDKSITSTRFALDRELVNYSSTDEYAWDTTLDQVLVTVRIKDFREGDTAIRIFDAEGTRVFTGALNTFDFVYFNGEDLFFQRVSDRGVPGRWTVVLGYNDFTGEYKLSLE